jgi:hypothetical protein
VSAAGSYALVILFSDKYAVRIAELAEVMLRLALLLLLLLLLLSSM